LYARAQLEDYWVVNLVDRTLEVYRQPVADASAPFGAPLAAPTPRVLVRDLLP